MTAITGAPATAATPAPTAVAAASVPLRFATTLLRWTNELTSGGCTTNYALSNLGGNSPCAAFVNSGIWREHGKRNEMFEVNQRVLFGAAGGLLVAASALAGGYYVISTRGEARAATPSRETPDSVAKPAAVKAGAAL